MIVILKIGKDEQHISCRPVAESVAQEVAQTLSQQAKTRVRRFELRLESGERVVVVRRKDDSLLGRLREEARNLLAQERQKRELRGLCGEVPPISVLYARAGSERARADVPPEWRNHMFK